LDEVKPLTALKWAVAALGAIIALLILYHISIATDLTERHSDVAAPAAAVEKMSPDTPPKPLLPIVKLPSDEEVGKWLDGREAERRIGIAHSLALSLPLLLLFWIGLELWPYWKDRDIRQLSAIHRLFRSGDYAAAVEVSIRLARRHQGKTKRLSRFYEASGLSAQGRILQTMGKGEEALIPFRQIIEMTLNDDHHVPADIIAHAMHSEATAQFYAGEYKTTIATLETLIARFSGSDDPFVVRDLERSRYNIACSHARLSDVRAAVQALLDWAEFRRGFDCKAVAEDSDFDPIRKRAAFKKLAQRFGCTA
jgi:tetratricopeptide (TPR) repeat protein